MVGRAAPPIPSEMGSVHCDYGACELPRASLRGTLGTAVHTGLCVARFWRWGEIPEKFTSSTLGVSYSYIFMYTDTEAGGWTPTFSVYGLI